MPVFRIHRLKDSVSQQFRWAQHTATLAIARPKDYDPSDQVEASTPYAAWEMLKESPAQLHPGDLLESDTGDLRIYKYIGFEPAQWQVPELKPESAADPSAHSAPQEHTGVG